MAALGDKIGSSLIAQAAEVPTLPWSGSHVNLHTLEIVLYYLFAWSLRI
jgi:biotin carboxylase